MNKIEKIQAIEGIIHGEFDGRTIMSKTWAIQQGRYSLVSSDGTFTPSSLDEFNRIAGKNDTLYYAMGEIVPEGYTGKRIEVASPDNLERTVKAIISLSNKKY